MFLSHAVANMQRTRAVPAITPSHSPVDHESFLVLGQQELPQPVPELLSLAGKAPRGAVPHPHALVQVPQHLPVG